VNVEKVKDMETGGKHTPINEPVMLDFNKGLGFEVYGIDPLQKHRPKDVQKTITDGIISTSQKLRNLNTF